MKIGNTVNGCKLLDRVAIAVTAISLAAIPALAYPVIADSENLIFSRTETWGLLLTCTALGMLLVFAVCALAFVLLKATHSAPEFPDSCTNRVIVAITVFAFSASFIGSVLYLNHNWQVFL